MGDFDRLPGEIQAARNSIVVDVNKDIQTLEHPRRQERQARRGSNPWNHNSRFARPRWPIWAMVDGSKCPPPQKGMRSDVQPTMQQGAQWKSITSFGNLRPTLGL